MLKRNLIFAVFLIMIPAVYFKTRDLHLAYYVFSTLLVFPLFYFYVEKSRSLFLSGLALFFFSEFFYIVRDYEPEMVLLCLEHVALIALLVFYHKRWEGRVAFESEKNKEILRDWEILKHKHQHRLDNLQHLEKQAASLMDLFEIARDFSECLSYATLADALHKKVRPELPFEEMDLLLVPSKGDNSEEAVHQVFAINAAGVTESERYLTELEKKDVTAVKKDRLPQVAESRWLFHLMIQQESLAYLTVSGAKVSDLAKFEVLVAHLVLQIKKIRLYDTVKALSIIDDLTQVFVRRHFMMLFEDELKRSLKHGFSLALLMLDIDHFKRYNDELGHLVGDATLREVAGILRSNLRKVDLVARFGGEEFIMAMPETGASGALEVAERIRSSIARHIYKVYDVNTKVTASIGVSVFPADCSNADKKSGDTLSLSNELISKADAALYRAKEEGRNRVVRYQDL